MRKIVLFLPFILAIFVVSTAIVDRAFKSKKVKISTTFFKSLDALNTVSKPTKKPIKQKVSLTNDLRKELLYGAYKDVEKLDFTNPKLNDKNNKNEIIKKSIVPSFYSKAKKKKIKDFVLQKKSTNFKNTEFKKEKISQNIIELNLEEKVQVFGYSKITKIKKTKWSIIFDYSMKPTTEKILVKPKLAANKIYKENKVTPIRISDNKKVKVENLKSIDRISTVMAATEKSNQSQSKSLSKNSSAQKKLEVITNEDKSSSGLVFFDYTTATKDLNTQKSDPVKKVVSENPENKVTIRQKSKSIKQPLLDFNNIKRSLENNKIAKTGSIGPKNKEPFDLPSQELSKLNDKKMTTQKISSYLSANKRNYKSEYSIQPYNVDGSTKNTEVPNFEIRFEDDIDDIIQSFGEGEIVLNDLLNTNMSIRRGTLYSASHYPTTVDFVLENNEIVAKIPLIQKEYFGKIVEENGLTAFGGQLLVELDNSTEDVEIEANYERKVFLNKYLKQVDRGNDEYSFILFIGVDTGNSILNFKTIKNKTVSKIIHIEDSEIYYEPNFYVEKVNDDFELNEEYLLSKEKGPLSIDPNEVIGLTFSGKIKKLTTNRYRINKVNYATGMRSYVELKHLSESVFVGRWDNNFVAVPSEQYMRHVLSNFNINSVGSNCLVQINLPKKASELYFNGQSRNGVMRMQTRILDKDGIFYTDLSNDSEKIFLLGEEQGIINVKVKYVDGSLDYLQSYCSDNTYLVEQL